MTRGVRLWWSSPTTRDTHTNCRAFSSLAIITSFYDLGPTRMKFEHQTFRFRGERTTAADPILFKIANVFYYFAGSVLRLRTNLVDIFLSFTICPAIHFHYWDLPKDHRWMAEILPIRRKTFFSINQSINQSVNQSTFHGQGCSSSSEQTWIPTPKDNKVVQWFWRNN